MEHTLFSIIIWTAAFAFIAYKADKDLGRPEGHIYIIHIVLCWIFLLLNITGFKMLGWAMGNPKAIFDNFFIPLGPLPAWFNLFTWAGNTAFNIIAILIALSLVKRKEIARIWLIKLLPFFYFFYTAEFLKGFYKEGTELIISLFVGVFISALIIAIPLGTLYIFYRKESVKVRIFNQK